MSSCQLDIPVSGCLEKELDLRLDAGEILSPL